MSEPPEILGAARWLLAQNGLLHGRKIVVTAGGTQEAIDPVRTITNRSSGKQGFALAQAALDLGAQVTLISAPVSLAAPYGAQRVEVESAAQMLDAVLAALDGADALLMAAAVADFRPAKPATQKIKKESGVPRIDLEPTADILKAVAQAKEKSGWPRLTLGFAAETQALLHNAQAKLQAKALDMIVANDISAADAGFAVDTNRVTVLYADGRVEALEKMSKADVAELVLARVAERIMRE